MTEAEEWYAPQQLRRRRVVVAVAVLVCVALLLPVLLLVAAPRDGLAVRLPWSGGVYSLGLEACSATHATALVVRRRPAYYQLSTGSDVVRLPLSPRCP